jgi:hypothetical protein
MTGITGKNKPPLWNPAALMKFRQSSFKAVAGLANISDEVIYLDLMSDGYLRYCAAQVPSATEIC